jgi:hypothetical protein
VHYTTRPEARLEPVQSFIERSAFMLVACTKAKVPYPTLFAQRNSMVHNCGKRRHCVTSRGAGDVLGMDYFLRSKQNNASSHFASRQTDYTLDLVGEHSI